MTPHPGARLARELFQRTVTTLAVLSALRRADAVAAVEAFVLDPRPSAYLAARRALREGLRARLAHAGAARRFANGLEALVASGLPKETLADLATLPQDPVTAGRLDALGALALARHEIAGRAASAAALLRARLGRAR